MSVDAASGSSAYANLIANSDAVTQTAAAANASKTDTSAAAAAKTKDDKNMFLKLLVAQLRYQDPSKPADTTAFMAQTAQFSALEAMQDVAAQSTSMVAAQNKLQASTMVGQTVSYTGEDGTVKTGTVKSVSFTQDSVGGTAGEPVLNVDGVSVVLSKVSGVGSIDAAAINAAAAKAAADAKAAAEGTTSSTTTTTTTTSTPTTATTTPATTGTSSTTTTPSTTSTGTAATGTASGTASSGSTTSGTASSSTPATA